MKTFEYTIQAGETATFPGGNFFVLMSTSAGVDVQFIKNGTSIDEDAESVEEGFSVRPVRPADGGLAFERVKITSAILQTVKLAISKGGGDYNALAGAVSATPVVATGLLTTSDKLLGAAATTSIIAANANRREVLITNKSTNTASIRVGDASAGATRGIEVQPGQTASIESTAEVFAYSVPAQSVGILEVIS